MFEENWTDSLTKYTKERAIRNHTLFGMYYFIDSNQYAGRYHTLTKNQLQDIGIEYDDMIRAINYYNSPIYTQIENMGIAAYYYRQSCLNGYINRERIIVNTMLYSIDIRKGNKIKYKI